MTINSLKSCETVEQLNKYLAQGMKDDDYVSVSVDSKGRRIKFKDEDSKAIDNVSVRQIIEQFKKVIAHDKANNVTIDKTDVRKILKKISKFENEAFLKKEGINPFVRLIIFFRSLFGNVGFDKHKELDVIRREFLSNNRDYSYHFKSLTPTQMAKVVKENLSSEDREFLKLSILSLKELLKELKTLVKKLEFDADGKILNNQANKEELEASKNKKTTKLEELEKKLEDRAPPAIFDEALEFLKDERSIEKVEEFLNAIQSDHPLFITAYSKLSNMWIFKDKIQTLPVANSQELTQVKEFKSLLELIKDLE